MANSMHAINLYSEAHYMLMSKGREVSDILISEIEVHREYGNSEEVERCCELLTAVNQLITMETIGPVH